MRLKNFQNFNALLKINLIEANVHLHLGKIIEQQSQNKLIKYQQTIKYEYTYLLSVPTISNRLVLIIFKCYVSQ